MNTLIKNGLIISSNGRFEGDVLIEEDRIVSVKEKINIEETGTTEIIEAKGKYVFPGVIDPHTHLEMPCRGTYSSDDFRTGTIAAACGGTTSLIDFELVAPDKTTKEAFSAKHKLASEKSVIDYGFHASYSVFNKQINSELYDVVNSYGSPNFKLYTTYDFKVNDKALINFMLRAAELGAIVQLHSENNAIINIMNEKFEKEKNLGVEYHPRSRPNIAEEEAVSRAIAFAKFTNAELYIVHISTKEALRKTIQARKEGLNVYVETCPQYLILDETCYETKGWDAAKYVISPPLRDRESCNALWEAIASGNIDTIGSDHCPFFLNGTKDIFGKNDYKKILGGAPGVETLLMLLHSEGVLKGKISLEKMVEVLSTNTARLFGMNNKGEITVGKDADIVIFDPKQKYTISYKTLHMNVDYNPYEGKEVTGMPYMVFSRGKKVAQWNKDKVEFLGQAGNGKFIHRKPFKPL
ncbi:MAG TPA: dihydropyrimidinase [Lentisphaeria bacterium]|nr:MAG: dihydropyrimidinase [Lentisphaerae bacterium GWF2_38_69]HBM15374.1 dihydropyrimidinase [Lentisphaeria bacterium]